MTINNKKRLYLAMMAFLIPLIYSTVAGATNYYADPVNGADANPGTLASPWKHVCYATGGGGIIWTGTNNSATSNCPTNNPHKLVAGDTLYLRGNGTFQENNIQFSNSGTSGSPITITTYTGDTRAIIDAGMTNVAPISGGHETFVVENDYLTFDNLEIMRGYQMNISIGRNNGGSHITIQNSNLHDIVAYDNSAHIYMSNGGCCITIQNNYIHGVQSTASNHSGAGVHSFILSNVTINNNEIYNNTLGIYIKQGTDAVSSYKVQNNYIHDNVYYGVLHSAPNSTYSHNLLENNNQGILVYESSADCSVLQSDHNTFSHNTLVGNTGYGINLDTGGGCIGASFTTVRDNIISGGQDGNFRELSIWHYATSDGSNTTLEYNLINGTTFPSPISIAGGYYSVTSLLSTLLGKVSTSIQNAPIFVNPTAHNYQLCAAGVSGCTISSPGRGAASDGTDMGARICQVGVNKASCPTAPAPPSNLRVN